MTIQYVAATACPQVAPFGRSLSAIGGGPEGRETGGSVRQYPDRVHSLPARSSPRIRPFVASRRALRALRHARRAARRADYG
jgi:hypothetical protein